MSCIYIIHLINQLINSFAYSTIHFVTININYRRIYMKCTYRFIINFQWDFSIFVLLRNLICLIFYTYFAYISFEYCLIIIYRIQFVLIL